jgi:hypothetical protein
MGAFPIGFGDGIAERHDAMPVDAVPEAEAMANFVHGLLEEALFQQGVVRPGPQAMDRHDGGPPGRHPEHEIEVRQVKIDFGDRENTASRRSPRLGELALRAPTGPIELNDNFEVVGNVYRYALKVAGVKPVYTAAVNDPGILICPTQYPHATLYVITSESNERKLTFRDERNNKEFAAVIEPGHAALLLIGEDGAILASYNWPSH